MTTDLQPFFSSSYLNDEVGSLVVLGNRQRWKRHSRELCSTLLVSTRSPEKNPFGNAFTMSERNLRQESEAIRDVNLAESRAWMVMNKNQKNSLGMPTSYMLMPSTNSIYYPNFQADSHQRGEFATHHFWATRYKANELYAAGDYPNQGKKGRGLPQYTADNESLDNEDLVIWYTYGVTHIPRPEE